LFAGLALAMLSVLKQVQSGLEPAANVGLTKDKAEKIVAEVSDYTEALACMLLRPPLYEMAEHM